jgi:hypothetical protein
MVSFYISRAGKAAVEALAAKRGQTKAETYRELLRIGLQHAPRKRPDTP